MASVEKNTFVSAAMRLPKSDIMPSANAMSVAIGIAQPCAVGAGLSSV